MPLDPEIIRLLGRPYFEAEDGAFNPYHRLSPLQLSRDASRSSQALGFADDEQSDEEADDRLSDGNSDLMAVDQGVPPKEEAPPQTLNPPTTEESGEIFYSIRL